MSVDHSLKIKGTLSRHRNVLTRTERIEKLKDEERWNDGDSLLGLPKVAHRKSRAGRKTATAEAAKETAAEQGAAQAATEMPAAKEKEK